MRPALLLTLAAIAAPGLALAQDRPLLQPTRDVTITYRVLGAGGQPAGAPGATPGQATELRMSWLVAQNRMRVDPPGMPGYIVADRAARRAFMVMESQRMVMEMPQGQQLPNSFGEPSPTARITRGGTETVAGLSCTIWQIEDQGRSARACVTSDGVMLRTLGRAGPQEGNREGGLEAVTVNYGPQDPARFQPPAGYQTMQMPAGMPGGMPGGPPGRPPGR
jgi:hypothetical protein